MNYKIVQVQNFTEIPKSDYSLRLRTLFIVPLVLVSLVLFPSWGETLTLDELVDDEKDTVIVQRRSIHSIRNLKKNYKIKKTDLKYLRPCPKNGITPYNYNKVVGKKTNKVILKNNIITFKDLY